MMKMMLMGGTTPLRTMPLVTVAFIALLIHCWLVENAPIRYVAAATIEDDNNEAFLTFDRGRQQTPSPKPVPSIEIDCSLRHYALDFAMDKIPWSSYSQIQHISDALRLDECPRNDKQTGKRNSNDPRNVKFSFESTSAQPLRGSMTQESRFLGEASTDVKSTIRLVVDPKIGSDKALGTDVYPLATIPAAIAKSRKLRNSSNSTISIVLRGGRYHLKEPLRLDSRDSYLTLEANENETPLVSGGDYLSLQMSPTPKNPAIYSAKLPRDTFYNFTMLFLDRSKLQQDDIRLVWAREPNGHPERDLQPDGYAAANGTDSKIWPDSKGAIHFVVKDSDRNSSVYPWHGEDLDPRGGGNWLHFGGTGNRFVDGKGYWNGSVPMGLKFRSESLNTTGWTSEGYAPAIVHVFHNAFWGNWQFEIDSVTTTGDKNNESDGNIGKISFQRGGWQEGRGGGVNHQPFFVEGVKEALDVPGEWWLDVPKQILYYYPFGNETVSDEKKFSKETLEIDFVAPRLQRLVEVIGEDNRKAHGISFRGLTFAHTATTFMEPYEVPSPGDWSIHRGGAVIFENTVDSTIQDCVFLRTGGNAIMISGYAKRSKVQRNEFAFIGDSAIATLGKIQLADGFTVDTYPEDTLIQANHFHDIGIHGKQTSALFSALSCKTTFVENVLYNGPRAGININDAFCHGHTIRENLLFNWVRETQDHGPINTWNRALYVQKQDSSQDPTLIPRWTHIERNFIMNGPSGNRDLGNLFPTIDNDDGSSYFYIAKNLLVYGGGKNYLGHDKIWTSNLFVFPGRWSGEPCAQIWGGKNHLFADNTCLVAPGNPPIGLDGSMKGFACKIDWNDPEFVGKTANNSYYMDQHYRWGFGCGNGTTPNHWFSIEEMQAHGWEIGSSIHDSNLLTPHRIIDLAKKLLSTD